MPLTPEQVEQFKRQLPYYRHDRYVTDVRFSNGFVLEHLIIEKNVFPPENFTAYHFGNFLSAISQFITHRMTVIDAYCGCGMQAVIAARLWNARVIAGDKQLAAVENTNENAKQYIITDRLTSVQSDSLDSIDEEVDVILANRNFAFDLTTEEYIQLREEEYQTVPRGIEIHKFFEQAKTRLKKNGIILMPYFHFWGEINDPGVQAPKHGYKIGYNFRFKSEIGVQRGPVSIYLLNPPKR